jgi:hypothetical protein
MNKDDIDEIVLAHSTGAMSTHWDKCYLTHPRCALHLLANELKYAMFAISDVVKDGGIEELDEGQDNTSRDRITFLSMRYSDFKKKDWWWTFASVDAMRKKFEQEMMDQND